ncbi:hypothetical protein DLJ48_01670 [Oenococcus sicerae]|uniref:Restriction endonuclease n=1 Tax=Oenococcus sicerae TaxID=2203724 RepID=A0ABX5QKW2_9LACO|nr:hypothetical protein [Oenococcus sicerae]QAS69322.1 hypothetical protein DLJ48_01670 [Oenococcus sicerae]
MKKMSPEKFAFKAVQLVEDSAICPLTKEAVEIIECVKSDVHWIDSSANGSGHQLPDFYNNELKLMIDVMEVDDNAVKAGTKNPERQAEAEARKRLEATGILKKNPNVEQIFIRPDTSVLSTSQHHSYVRYCHNFQRVIRKHNQSIKNNYLKNHPGFKTVFMVEDSSTMYLQTKQKIVGNLERGSQISGQPHIPIIDKRLMKSLIGSDINFLIWYFSAKPWDITLTKQRDSDFVLPTIFVLDIEKINPDILIDYDAQQMVAAEA